MFSDNIQDSNYNLSDIKTPVKVEVLEKLLIQSSYDKEESQFLLQGFRNGFDLGYEGPMNRMDTSNNLPFHVGDQQQLWDKMIKEVKLDRFAGPFKSIPFDHYIQSPIGLVPKANQQTCLIFHLSYDFKGGGKSVNAHIPKHKCTVKYKDLDDAVKKCLMLLQQNPGEFLWFGISDLKSAFRVIPLKKSCWILLVMKARNPVTNQWFYFVDKCLPFRAASSCNIFQRFSNALAHIAGYEMKHLGNNTAITNYLDDFLNIALKQWICDEMLNTFHKLCDLIGVPLAKEKMVWGL